MKVFGVGGLSPAVGRRVGEAPTPQHVQAVTPFLFTGLEPTPSPRRQRRWVTGAPAASPEERPSDDTSPLLTFSAAQLEQVCRVKPGLKTPLTSCPSRGL